MAKKIVALLCLVLQPASAAVVHYEWVIRDWVVDFLRPTINTSTLCKGNNNEWPVKCGSALSKLRRELPFDIPRDNLKAAQLINGQYPGPTIEAFENDTIEVHVVNRMLSAATTIHWHGLWQVGTPWEDGPVQVTQASIRPGYNYTYRFQAYPAGTHYYHSHMDALQQSRGVKGGIIIRKKADPFAGMYTEDRLVHISDEWRNPEACFKIAGAMPGNLVCSDAEYTSFNGQFGDGSKKYPWPLISVRQGQCYRFRWLNMGGNSENFIMDIAGHNMTLVSTDGHDVKPVKVTSVNVHNGERIDTVVCADQEPGYYLITANYDYGCTMLRGKKFTPPGFHPVSMCKWYAFLHYEGTSASLPPQADVGYPKYEVPKGTGGGAHPALTAGVEFDTTKESGWSVTGPLEDEEEPEEPDLRITVSLGMVGDTRITPEMTPPGNFDQSGGGRWYADLEDRRMSWEDPTTPLLHTKGKCGAENTPVINIPENVTNVELIINNLSPTEHVMHLHGGNFKVINYRNFEWCSMEKSTCFVTPVNLSKCPSEDRAVGDPNNPSPYVPDLEGHVPVVDAPIRLPWIHAPLYWGCKYNARKDRSRQNLKTPLRKDTLPIWQRSWAVIRFKATNPGMWLFHCHLQPHIPLGMVSVFNVRPSEQPPIPYKVESYGTCPVWSWREKYLKESFELERRAQELHNLYGETPEVTPLRRGGRQLRATEEFV